MGNSFERGARLMGALALALCAAPDAFAGKWLSQELGATPPLWYEYRASVNDSGVIAASTLSGSLTQPVVSVSGTNLVALTTPAMTGVDLPVVQGAAMDVSANDRVVGFRAAASSGQRQASLWTRNGASWVHRDLHSAVVALRPSDTISAAYGLAPVAAGEHLVAGYRRARINPQALSEPVIWSVTDSAMSAHALPLPAASFDDSGDNQPTPKPRARLISRQTYPGTNRRVRMELCLYIDVVDGNRGQVNIKDMRHYAGQARTSTHDGPSHSPANDARGQCLETDDNGVADIVVYDYDNKWSTKEDAYVHFVVRPKDDISALHCDQTLYTLYYGNDKRAGVSAGTGYDANRTGCVSCCN